MLFKLINVSNLEWDKAVDFEADSIVAACEYVLKNAYKFSNWHILRDDTVQVCYKTVDGDWFIAAFIDLHKNEVVTKLYDGRRAPEPYVETAEQGELADVENTSASEQDNTVEKSFLKASLKSSVKYLPFPICIFAFIFLIILFSYSGHFVDLNKNAFAGGFLFSFAFIELIRLTYYSIHSFVLWFKQRKAVDK